MAAIDLVGAHMTTAAEAPAGAQFSRYSFRVELFAELVDGSRVLADEALHVGCPELPDTPEDLARGFFGSLAHEDMPLQKRAAFWKPLVQALRGAGIETDAETLMRLTFDVELGEDVAALFE